MDTSERRLDMVALLRVNLVATDGVKCGTKGVEGLKGEMENID